MENKFNLPDGESNHSLTRDKGDTNHNTTEDEFNMETVLFDKKCVQSLLNNGDYRQVSIFFQTTFMNLTQYIFSIFKLRMSKRYSAIFQRKCAGPITHRSLDRNHSLLCIIHLVFESNNFKLKVIIKLFFFIFIFLCLHNHPPIAQLVERRTVVAALAGLLRSLNQTWLGGQHFCK